MSNSEAVDHVEHFAIYSANADYHRQHRAQVRAPNAEQLGRAIITLGLPRAVEVYRAAYDSLDFVRRRRR
jgi:hypothetical protein